MSSISPFNVPGGQHIPNINSTLGAVMIGMLASAVGCGVTCIQAYTYFLNTGKRDNWVLRGLIVFLWIVDGLLVLLFGHIVYFYSISNYFNPAALGSAPWTAPAFVAISNMSDTITRSIFIFRIAKLSKSKYSTLLYIFNLGVFGFALGLAIRLHQIGSFQRISTDVSWIVYCAITQVAVLDTLIAAILCAILWNMRNALRSYVDSLFLGSQINPTSIYRTDTMLQTISRYSIHTGLLTSVAAIIVLITYGFMPHNFVYIGIYVNLPKLYFNALLATLNARDMPPQESSSTRFTSVPLSQLTSVNMNDYYSFFGAEPEKPYPPSDFHILSR
ncbi:hypothetical protein C8Q75DRAFT_804759 [Abortiporus biennis]|nr:hypothetical protein C8Q75DRAFT_804759 [Abortiporus biennis]